jgi:hypothetical protein
MNVNDKIIFRTCGRGKARVWKGTIKAIVNTGKLAPENLRDKLPHGDESSNRPRYIVKLDKLGKGKVEILMWANATGPNIVAAGKKLPKHEPRIASKKGKVKKVAKVKAKKPAKVKAKVKKAAPKPKAKKVAKPKKTAKAKRVVASKKDIVDNLSVIPTTTKPPKAEKKRSGGDKPKTTWYGVKDGKIVSVRKVVCPEGFSLEKPKLDLPSAPAAEPASEPTQVPATPAAETTAALPQASLG